MCSLRPVWLTSIGCQKHYGSLWFVSGMTDWSGLSFDRPTRGQIVSRCLRTSTKYRSAWSRNAHKVDGTVSFLWVHMLASTRADRKYPPFEVLSSPRFQVTCSHFCLGSSFEVSACPSTSSRHRESTLHFLSRTSASFVSELSQFLQGVYRFFPIRRPNLHCWWSH